MNRQVQLLAAMCIAATLPLALAQDGGTPTPTPTPTPTQTPAVVVAKDPGVRNPGGPSNSGQVTGGATVADQFLFDSGSAQFATPFSVSGTVARKPGIGLGPRFNGSSCSSCHTQPAVGGSSYFHTSQAAANRPWITQTLPNFLPYNGPSVAARLKSDGKVHQLFTISNMADAPGCQIAQPNWNAEYASGNVVLRAATPLFGAGLLEAISDATILANKLANGGAKLALGIFGRENYDAAGRVGRFGWKSQLANLLDFYLEAYAVEMSVTNYAFPAENDPNPACNFHTTLEDQPLPGPKAAPGPFLEAELVTHFLRFLAQPKPFADTASIINGRALFNSIGCAMCHTAQMTTGPSTASAFNNRTAKLYSDLLLHHMGATIADDIPQGQAGGDEFRTAPLWGLSQRIFFLHDGRTNDLNAAITLHAGQAGANYPASEADAVVDNYLALTEPEKQDILNFLRSL